MKIKTKIISFVLATVCLFTSVGITCKANAADPTTGEQTVIEWKRVRSYDDLPQDKETTTKYYMYLVWAKVDNDDDERDPNKLSSDSDKTIILTPYRKVDEWNSDGTPKSYTKDLQGTVFDTSAYSKVFSVKDDTFVTSSPYGMPQLIYTGNDGDNGDCPEYKLKMNAGKGDYINTDGNCFGYSSSSGTSWGIAVRQDGVDKRTDYENSAEFDGCVTFYYNRSGARDSGFMTSGERLWSEKDKDYDDFSAFMMWVGTEVTYSCITADYNILPGETFSVKDRVIIKKGVTVNVYPGGVFCVDGTLISDGTINNYGTLIVEEEGEIFPMAMGTELITDSGAINPKGNTIYNYGSEKRVSVPGYSKSLVCEGTIINKGNIVFGTGMGCFYNYSNALLENSGLLFVSSDMVLMDSTMNNTGTFGIGYIMKNPALMLGYNCEGYPVDEYIVFLTWKTRIFGWGVYGVSASYDNDFRCSRSKLTNDGGIVYYGNTKQTW